MCKRLLGKNAVITGAARGMGLTIAKSLYNEGARIAILDVDDVEIRKAAHEISSNKDSVLGRRVDVTNRNDVFQFFQELKAQWDSVDILVNNAGGALNTPHILEEIKEEHWDLVVGVNLKGAFFCCQAVIPEMVKQGGGCIINMSALAGHWRASLAGVQYTAAKAGLEGLTRQLAYDWGKHHIRVNAVAPTVTLTGERVQGLWENKSDEEKQKVLANIPLSRLGTPEEIASTVVFLASNESSYISGITIDVSGGRYLR